MKTLVCDLHNIKIFRLGAGEEGEQKQFIIEEDNDLQKLDDPTDVDLNVIKVSSSLAYKCQSIL